jgi:hypothetical protein
MSMRQEKRSAAVSGFWLSCIAIVVFAWLGGTVAGAHRVSCTDKTIPYETTTTNDPNAYVGTNSTLSYGTNGTEHVCTHKDGTVVSDVVTVKPVNKVVTSGTKQFEVYTPPAVTAQRCAVTLCNDGSCSFSQGRGTCSWHGGVAEYY